MRNERAQARRRRDVRDAEYRAALGLPSDGPLPASLGTVGGSRGGHAGRINQTTTGRPAGWRHPTRSAPKRRGRHGGERHG
ncbi:hypothetical protein E0F15_20465 [Frankia sp. B2]|uniref:hypothetical protein n=1 Tax=unclassified Frankia TaxID=2632575 RepID=UPI000A8E1991|nr:MULTISPECIES: hypothetical protein [unclassified Frankia]TFE25099.1 hypothetical protein E0F15_20465 [Frankia sp. B2]